MAPTTARCALRALLTGALLHQGATAFPVPGFALRAFLLEAVARGALAQYSVYPAPVVAGGGASGFLSGSVNGAGTNALFYNVYFGAVGGDGNVYVTEWYPSHTIGKVRMVYPNGTAVTFAGGGSSGLLVASSSNPVSAVTSSLADTSIANALFLQPTGIAVASDGTVYVAESGYSRIRKISSSTGYVSIIAGGGATGMVSGSADGVGSNALFSLVNGIDLDNAGGLYVADSANNKIRYVSPFGVTSTLAGSTMGSADGFGTSAAFSMPYSIAVGPTGNIFVADSSNNRIRRVTPDGGVTTLAGFTSGSIVNGVGTNARFSLPYGLTVDAAGSVFVADTNNNVIRRIAPDGTTTSIAVTSAALSIPRAVAVSPSSTSAAPYLIVMNTGYYSIRNVSLLNPSLCPSGQYCTTTNFSCIALTYSGPGQFTCCTTPGTTAGASAGYPQTTCTACGAGAADAYPLYAATPAVACAVCAAGTIQPLTTAAAGCTSCANGAYSTAGATLCLYNISTCPAGTFASPPAACQACAAGAYCAGGAASPAVCPAGSFCPLGAVMPIACPANTYANTTGTAACKPCPANTATLYAGAASLSDCIPSVAAFTDALPCNATSLNAAIPIYSAIFFPPAANVTDAAPLLYLPASSPLNPGAEDVVVATAAACAAFAGAAGGACVFSQAFALNGGTYYYMGAAAALGMTAGGQCGV